MRIGKWIAMDMAEKLELGSEAKNDSNLMHPPVMSRVGVEDLGMAGNDWVLKVVVRFHDRVATLTAATPSTQLATPERSKFSNGSLSLGGSNNSRSDNHRTLSWIGKEKGSWRIIRSRISRSDSWRI